MLPSRKPDTHAAALVSALSLLLLPFGGALAACSTADEAGSDCCAPAPSRGAPELRNQTGALLTVRITKLSQGTRFASDLFAAGADAFVPLDAQPPGARIETLAAGASLPIDPTGAWISFGGDADGGTFVMGAVDGPVTATMKDGKPVLAVDTSSEARLVPGRILPACAGDTVTSPRVSWIGSFAVGEELVAQAPTRIASGCLLVKLDAERGVQACVPDGAWPFAAGAKLRVRAAPTGEKGTLELGEDNGARVEVSRADVTTMPSDMTLRAAVTCALPGTTGCATRRAEAQITSAGEAITVGGGPRVEDLGGARRRTTYVVGATVVVLADPTCSVSSATDVGTLETLRVTTGD